MRRQIPQVGEAYRLLICAVLRDDRRVGRHNGRAPGNTVDRALRKALLHFFTEGSWLSKKGTGES